MTIRDLLENQRFHFLNSTTFFPSTEMFISGTQIIPMDDPFLSYNKSSSIKCDQQQTGRSEEHNLLPVHSCPCWQGSASRSSCAQSYTFCYTPLSVVLLGLEIHNGGNNNCFLLLKVTLGTFTIYQPKNLYGGRREKKYLLSILLPAVLITIPGTLLYFSMEKTFLLHIFS